MEFRFHMFANTNSIKCLRENVCQPLGGYSVWSAFGAPNKTNSLVLAMAGFDATSFFHEDAVGAETSVSGTVALIAAAHALANAPPQVVNISSLPHQLVFAFFTGENYGYVGSRKFLAEIQNFTCLAFPDNDPSKPSCSMPYKPSLRFQQLNVSRIRRALELKQVAMGLSSTVYTHFERNNSASAAFASEIASLGWPTPTLDAAVPAVQNASADTPGIPPSSMQTFVGALPATPAVVLTDHAGAYVNKFFNGDSDNLAYLSAAPSSASRANRLVCQAATIAARALFVAAATPDNSANATVNGTVVPGGAAAFNASAVMARAALINADCSVVDQLMRSFLGSSHYTSVYTPRYHSTIGGFPRIIYNWMFNASAAVAGASNTSSSSSGSSSSSSAAPVSYTYFHDAVDPGLELDYTTFRYRVVGGDAAAAAWPSLLWAESNWSNDVGVTWFRTEDPDLVLAQGVVGGGLVLLCLIVTFFAARVCQRKFKWD